jgi:high-affinity nickel-transport protein
MGPFGSALITGLVFGLGFDTATQISALTLTVAASATLGIQVALILAGFFALGMIPVDTLDSVILRSAFSRIFDTKGFTYMAYALSGLALAIAAMESYSVISKSDVLPDLTGPVLAVIIICAAFGYGFATRKKVARTNSNQSPIDTKPKEETET